MCGHNLYAVFVAETRWERSSKKKNARCLQKNDQYCRVAEDPRNLKTNGRQVCAHHRGGSHFRPQSLLAKVDSPMVVKFVTEENLTILKASTLVTVSERSWRSPLESHHRHADGEPHRCASQHVHSYDSRVTVAGVGLPAARLCGTTTSEVCIETALCSSPSERRRM